MIGRLLQAADFKRLLAVAPRARSAHFVVHHLRGVPTGAFSTFRKPSVPSEAPAGNELSTAGPRILSETVDKFGGAGPKLEPKQAWMGVVIPKKQARRAVTRNLVRRQIKAVSQQVLGDRATDQAAGLWLVRLKTGFPVSEFPSAQSAALRRAVRLELGELLEKAVRRLSEPQVKSAQGSRGSEDAKPAIDSAEAPHKLPV